MIILSLSGEGSRRLAASLKRDHQRAEKVVKRVKQRQSLLNLPKSGWKLLSTDGDDLRLLRIYKANMKQTAVETQPVT